MVIQKPMRAQSTCRIKLLEAREKKVTKARLVLVLHPIGREGGASFPNQSENTVQSWIAFNNYLKTYLLPKKELHLFVFNIIMKSSNLCCSPQLRNNC